MTGTPPQGLNIPLKFFAGTKESDETIINDTTLTDDGDVHVTLKPNRIYVFICIMVMIEVSTVPDFKYSFSVPSGATGGYRGSVNWSSASAATEQPFLQARNIVSDMTLGSSAITYGRCITGNDEGELALQWAAIVSSGDGLTLRKGTVLMVWDVTP